MAAFIILLIATFGTSLIPLWINKDKAIWLNFLLSFSGAFLLGVTLLHIIPELYLNEVSTFSIGIFVMLGFFVQVVLESYSKGIEHGHIHIHDFGNLPYGLFMALTTHAVLEGSSINGLLVDKKEIIFAVLIHKIPVAFLLGYLFFSIKVSKVKAFTFLLIFALATPLGGYLTSNISMTCFSMPLQTILMAMATGSFLHVSTTILFETSPEHKLRINKFIPALLGGILAICTANFEI